MKSSINIRCPLANECERKRCDYNQHELDCIYYSTNGIGENVIEDQEEIRTAREMTAVDVSWLENCEDDRPEIEYLPVALLRPHPDNPRKDLGDVTELAQSIKANGIYQNLTVIPSEEDGAYTVIIGHRRLAAAKAAGLTEVPCIITEMSRKEQLSTMLLENMQRSDLTVFEQAQGFQMMLDLGETVETIAKESGFSTSTVRRRVKMMELDQEVLKEVSSRQLSLSDFDKLAQISDLTVRNRCLHNIGTHEFNYEVKKALNHQKTKENLPGIKALMRTAKAKLIKDGERYSCGYDRIGSAQLYEWDGTPAILPKKCDGQLFYYLDLNYCQEIEFYERHKRKAPIKRPEAEIRREHQLREVWKKVEELQEVAYQLRWDFIREQKLNYRNVRVMMEAAVISGVLYAFDFHGADRVLYCETLNIEAPNRDRAEKVIAAFEEGTSVNYPVLIYASFGDGKNEGYTSDYKSRWPEHKRNPRLDALYHWLGELGYEMSAEERSMQDGTHKVFRDPEDDADD